MKGFIIQTVMRPPRFKVDKSSTISFDTGEMSAQDKMKLLEVEGSIGTVAFEPEESSAPPQIIDSKFQEKTPSKRLYNVLFVRYKNQTDRGIIDIDFDTFYKMEMEKIIEAEKLKIDNI